jgi:hypothetical protein
VLHFDRRPNADQRRAFCTAYLRAAHKLQSDDQSDHVSDAQVEALCRCVINPTGPLLLAIWYSIINPTVPLLLSIHYSIINPTVPLLLPIQPKGLSPRRVAAIRVYANRCYHPPHVISPHHASDHLTYWYAIRGGETEPHTVRINTDLYDFVRCMNLCELI